MAAGKHTTLAALRDFFLSRTGDDLAKACAALACAEATERGISEMGEVDWQQAEFVFNKLFVGPAALKAPPYASFYLETEPQLMGESTLRVRRLYEMAGLVSPLQGSLPDDHLGVELDGALGMLTLAERFATQEARALWSYFLHKHMGAWLPLFLNKARNADTGHPAVDLALHRLEEWLRNETKDRRYVTDDRVENG